MLSSKAWRRAIDQIVRLMSGAFLFGVPLLYTMEMWWIGQYVEIWKLALFLTLALAVGIPLALFGRTQNKIGLLRSIGQSIVSVSIGILAAMVVLAVLNRIAWGDPLKTVMGMVLIQSVPLGIGAAAANAMFTGGEEENSEEAGESFYSSPWRAALNDVSATLAGAVFVALPIAPTDEIEMLAVEMTFWHELALVGLTLLVSYAIVFESGFSPEQTQAPGPFQHPITETVLSYLISLVVAFVSLYLFDRVQLSDPLTFIVSRVVVLSLPAAIGGAAGRVVI